MVAPFCFKEVTFSLAAPRFR